MAQPGGHRRILVLTSTFPRSESDTAPAFVYDLCKWLTRQGFAVDVLAPHSSGASTHEVIGGIKVYRYRYFIDSLQTLAYDGGIVANLKQQKWRYLLIPFFLMSQLYHTARLLRHGSYDLVHVHWLIPQGFIAVLAARLFANKETTILVTSHGSDLFAFNSTPFRQIKQWTLNNIDKLVVVSDFMKTRYQQSFPTIKDIEVCSMGVDLTQQFIPAENARDSDNRLIYVGRLIESKGVAYLLEAVNALCQQGEDIYLDIVGDGPDMSRLLDLRERLQLQQQVVFHGARPNVQLPGFYQRASIAVVPSIITANNAQEGLGLTTIEAMGCECAVVASSLSAFKEVILDEQTGLLCQPADATALASKIKTLLDNEALRQSLATAGRQRVLQLFDWQHIADKYTQLIENTINSEK